MKKLLIPALALVALATFAALGVAPQKSEQRTFSPCDKWGRGGPGPWDPAECDQLLRKGFLVKNKQLLIIPGTTLKWQIVPKKTAQARATPLNLEGLEVIVVHRNDKKSVVARTRTGKEGRFQFTIPSNVSGGLQLQLHPAPGQELPVHTFEYCNLPPIENVLTPMCADDPELVCLEKTVSPPIAPAPPSQTQKPCSQANTELLERLSLVEKCNKAEKQGRPKEAKDCRSALKNVPLPLNLRTAASACPDIGPGGGPALKINCWSGMLPGGEGAWAICCGGGVCCGGGALHGCASE